jgi:hypothetical protein
VTNALTLSPTKIESIVNGVPGTQVIAPGTPDLMLGFDAAGNPVTSKDWTEWWVSDATSTIDARGDKVGAINRSGSVGIGLGPGQDATGMMGEHSLLVGDSNNNEACSNSLVVGQSNTSTDASGNSFPNGDSNGTIGKGNAVNGDVSGMFVSGTGNIARGPQDTSGCGIIGDGNLLGTSSTTYTGMFVGGSTNKMISESGIGSVVLGWKNIVSSNVSNGQIVAGTNNFVGVQIYNPVSVITISQDVTVTKAKIANFAGPAQLLRFRGKNCLAADPEPAIPSAATATLPQLLTYLQAIGLIDP